MLGYIITVIITAAAALGVTAVLAERTVRLVSRQIKLNRSINLVELRTHRLIYLIAAGAIGFFIFYTVMQMADDGAPAVKDFYELFGVGRLETNLALLPVLIVMAAAEAFIILLALSKSAVVDKGISTGFGLLDWHSVRDYIIDEERGTLVLSADKATFLTLKNVTVPFKVARSDIQKLTFILNKNKNKFSDFDGAISESAKAV